MPFAYRALTISGAAAGVEGSAKLIQEFKNVMVSNMGWVVTDDQTNRAGTSHQLTLESNGESGTNPTFYLILTSGTGAVGTLGQDVINVRASTAWDTITHRVATSGVGVPVTSGTNTLLTDSNGNYDAWISGDKDGVVLITMVGATYDGAVVARLYQFTNPLLDPFPIVVAGSTSQNVEAIVDATGTVHSFLGPTVALGTNAVSLHSVYNQPLGVDQSPDNIFGAIEGYVAFPVIASISDNTSTKKSVRGIVPNLWNIIGKSGSTASYANEDELVTGDGKTYQIFFDGAGGARSVLIRKS